VLLPTALEVTTTTTIANIRCTVKCGTAFAAYTAVHNHSILAAGIFSVADSDSNSLSSCSDVSVVVSIVVL
jgi:hypothetical protein